jgi:16S rRNA (guanine1207-N2)-methyltransferase
MDHYFSEHNNNLKSNPKVIAFSVNNTPLKFKTDHGVFSKGSFDRGTNVLLDYLVVNDEVQSILDLGCGYGVIGIYLKKAYDREVVMVDINNRAVELSRENTTLNNVETTVIQSDGFANIDNKFDLIVFNPPIRAGKEVIYKLFEDSINYLTDYGEITIVINKKHGANSAINKLMDIYGNAEIIGKNKGFHVVRCKKTID